MREGWSRDTLARIYEAVRKYDVVDDLARVAAPTLVMHARRVDWFPEDASRRIASIIPNAHLAILDFGSLNPWVGNSGPILEMIKAFLRDPADREVSPTARIQSFRDLETQQMTVLTYDLKDRVATITMDDGKANVLSSAMIAELNGAFERAEQDGAAVVLTGREGMFSGGFDLKELGTGGPAALALVRSGFELADRVLSFPNPVVIACPGHAIAMGVFLLLSADYRIGARGAFKYQANEVAIGLPMPRAAIEMCRGRLTPAAYQRAIVLAEVFSPEDALQAGFVDRLVEPAELADAATSVAEGFLRLNAGAHTVSKSRAREAWIAALRAAIVADFGE